MTEEQRVIFTMVREGRLTVEQAERLLAALSPEIDESDARPEPDHFAEPAGDAEDWTDETCDAFTAHFHGHLHDEMRRVHAEVSRARDQVHAELQRVMPEVRRAHDEVRRAVVHALGELRRVF
jgi:SHOCT-like domain